MRTGEGTPFGKAVFFDQHLKIPGNGMGRICQHWVVDLFDPVRGIMPGLVNEMSVGGDGIDLTANAAELLILVCQVLQFRGAHKGKVCRIEEKDDHLRSK